MSSRIITDHNTVQIAEGTNPERAAAEQQIAQRVGTALVEAYDQRQWKVIVNIDSQMLIIGCDSICNYKGYHIHMMGRTIEELIEKAKMGAGEILERHELARTRKFNPEIFDGLARDSRHSVIAPDSAPEPVNG